MKFLEKMSSKMAKSASTAVKDEVKNTTLDLLPTAIGVGGMILSVIMLKDRRTGGTVNGMTLPKYSTITINNYYFSDDNFGKELLSGRQQKEEHISSSATRKRQQRKSQ